jgi:hypothetical protein
MRDFNAHWPDVRIEDVYYVLGHAGPTKHDWRAVERMGWYQSLPKRFPSMPPDINLPHAYNEYCYRKGYEPDWTKLVPTQVLRELRRSWLTGEYFDPLAIVLRYREKLGFTYAVHDDGLIHDVSIALGVFRLNGIRQLGFLHDPVMNEAAVDCGLGMRFEHTRYLHSLMVMATASLIGRQVGLSEHDLRHLRVAALTHDVLTPAGGDSVKPIDFEAFDEDLHYPEVFRANPEWSAVRDQYSLDEALLIRTVAGEGLLGRLLDIADKTAYTAHDVEAYLMGDHDPRSFQNLVAPESILAIYDLKQRLGPGLCQLWDRIEVVDGEPVITDIDRLVGFLKLRALMFRHLYYNPLARYREHMIALLILEPLYHDGTITRERLITMTDDQLDQFLNRTTGQYDLRMEISRADLAPAVEAYASRDEALGRAQALHRENPDLLFMLEVIPRVSEKAVRYLVRDSDGSVKTLSDARPDDTEAIRAIDYDPLPAKLYILSPEKMERVLPTDLREKLRARQRAHFGLE